MMNYERTAQKYALSENLATKKTPPVPKNERRLFEIPSN
jgi:hypothetical protein